MYSFHHHRRCINWTVLIASESTVPFTDKSMYVPLRCTSYTWCGTILPLSAQCWARVAAHCWFNRLRRLPNTNPTLGLLYTLRQHIIKHMTFTQSNAVLILTHSFRCWPNIETELGDCPAFALTVWGYPFLPCNQKGQRTRYIGPMLM